MTPFEVGVHLTTKNDISGVLAVISKELLGLTTGVGKLRQEFEGLNKLLIGGVAIGAGIAVAHVYKDLAKHGEELLNQKERLIRLGRTEKEVAAATAEAYGKIAKAVPTAAASTILKTAGELYSVTGDWTKAMAAAPMALKIDALVSNAIGKQVEGEGFKLWRSLEMKGITAANPELTNKLLDAFIKDIVGSGGKLSAADYQAMARTGGAAWMRLSPQFAAGPLSVVAADLGGDRTGTAIMSLYQFLTGANTLSKQQGDVLRKAGLLDMSKVTTDLGGRLNVGPGGIVGSAQGINDPYAWATNILNPALQKMSGGDRGVMDSLLGKIGRNRNVIRMLQIFTDPDFRVQIEKDMTNWAQAMGIDQGYAHMIAYNPKAIEAAYEAQKTSMLEAIGAPLMQAAIPVMKEITGIFSKIGELASANAGGVKLIGEGIAALAAALTVGGAVTVATTLLGMSAAIAGWPIAAAAAVVAALSTLVALNWSTISSGITTLITKLNEFSDALRSIVGKIGSWLKDMLPSWMHTSFTGSDFGGASIHKAAWTGGGGSGVGAIAAGERGKYAALIKATGGAYASDLLKIYGTEGASGYVGDHGTSFGPFQFHYGGGSIGDIFTRETGLDARNPATIGAQIEFMKRWGAKHGGYSSDIWHGLRGHGGSLASPHTVPHVAPYRKPSPPTIIENTMFLDGEVVHRSVVRRIVERATHPTSAPMHDGARHWTPPDSGLVAV